ncbi:hypothetical protein BV378_18235 [Nostoc sp. RF31YmG]|nr:hypothetical protein BV378_18235 [Nostoc sp. RF31YmG]
MFIWLVISAALYYSNQIRFINLHCVVRFAQPKPDRQAIGNTVMEETVGRFFQKSNQIPILFSDCFVIFTRQQLWLVLFPDYLHLSTEKRVYQ